MLLKNLKSAENRDTAIISITENGKKLADNLSNFFPNSQIFNASENLTGIFKKAFQKYKNIIAIMAVGIVVRKVANFIHSKTTDPAVVVVDEKGKFAISLLSGHIGGANELAEYVSKKIGAMPVVTTATDVNNKFAIDILSLKTGWKIENSAKIKDINSGILNDDKIAVNIPKEFLMNLFPEYNEKILNNFIFLKNIELVLNNKAKLKVIVSNRLNIKGDFLLFRPKNIYVGVGCNRGTTLNEIENVILNSIKNLNRSFESINSISSFELKSDEPALIEFSKKYGIDLIFYDKDEINSVKEGYEPSKYLIKNIGVKGVCEPSAILSAKKDMNKCFKRMTLLPKQKQGNVTIAIQELNFL